MGKIHGRNTFFSVTDIGGVVRDLSAYLNNVDHPDSIDSAGTDTFGSADKSSLPGLKGRTLKIAGFFDLTATTGPDDVLDNLKGGGAAGTVISSYVYGPGGSAVGNIKYSGSCYLTSYQKTSPIGGAVTFSADFMCTGAETRGTY